MGVSDYVKLPTAFEAPEHKTLKSEMNSFYRPEPTNWFEALPYCFKFTSSKNYIYRFYLPIAPSNITTTTPFATNIIPTLYSTVEEHSEQRYYDIVIEGTTGIAPQYHTMVNPIEMKSQSVGRTSFDVYKPLFGGFFAKTESIIKNTINLANDISSLVNGNNGDTSNPTGVTPETSGYMAFHNFYRFLLAYKKDAAKGPILGLSTKNHPLSFLNYKDGVEYKCIIQQFVLRRSADSPFLYNYSIVMRCFDMQSIDSMSVVYTDQLDRLGLAGMTGSSLMNKMRNVSNSAKGVIGGISAGFKVLGS